MRSHPVGLDVWFLVGPFVYFHTSCVRTAKALVRLCGCAVFPEPSRFAYKYHNLMSWLKCTSCYTNHTISVQLYVNNMLRHFRHMFILSGKCWSILYQSRLHFGRSRTFKLQTCMQFQALYADCGVRFLCIFFKINATCMRTGIRLST